MKHRKTLLIFFAVVAGAILWLFVQITRPAAPYALLKYLPPNSAGNPYSVHALYATNLSCEAIQIRVTIEEKTHNGWRTYTNLIASKVNQVAPFESAVAMLKWPPPCSPWRVHAEVSTAIHGLQTLPQTLRFFSIRSNRALMSRRFGWQLWKWPPFREFIVFQGKAFQWNSEEVDSQ